MKKYTEPLDIICHKIGYTGKNKGLGNAHTHGLEDYGKFNICLGIELNNEDTENILNTVAELYCDPEEEFNVSLAHLVKDENDEDWFAFYFQPVFCFEEPNFLIVLADENGNFPEDKDCLEPYKSQLKNHHDIEFIPLKNGTVDFDAFTRKQLKMWDDYFEE